MVQDISKILREEMEKGKHPFRKERQRRKKKRSEAIQRIQEEIEDVKK